jgi:hypothetical protein
MRNSTGGIAREWTAYTVSGYCGWVPLGINILWLELCFSFSVEIRQVQFQDPRAGVSMEAEMTLFPHVLGWKLSGGLVCSPLYPDGRCLVSGTPDFLFPTKG